MSAPVVAVVHLGRDRSMGAAPRVSTWLALGAVLGVETREVRLLDQGRATIRDAVGGVRLIATGRAIPESLAWSARHAAAVVDALAPTAVVLVTVRTVHPALMPPDRRVVVDHVDRLSASYRLRASLTMPPRREAFRFLAACSRRCEGHLGRYVVQTAAGRRDADELGATWLPNLAPAPPTGAGHAPDVDALFFGNLAYSPNVAAVRRLSRVWPVITARRPRTTLLIAGRGAGSEVRALCQRHRWELVDDFGALGEITARARLAVAPLEHATGIQNKVLEAAAHGLPLVISQEVARGLDSGFPAEVVMSDTELVEAVVSLLDNDQRRLDLARACQAHVAREYAADTWAPVAARLLLE